MKSFIRSTIVMLAAFVLLLGGLSPAGAQWSPPNVPVTFEQAVDFKGGVSGINDL